MKYSFTPLAFGLAASAAVIRRDQCCFDLTASGSQSGTSGTVGQLSDGQNRIGGGLPAATYCINNGAITDSSGRGCILTPPTTQFQCDTGATAQSGFAIGSNGEVTYSGSSTFYACATGDNGEYNIYTESVAGQSECYEITLASSGCGSSGSSSSAAGASTPATSAAASVTEAATSEAAPETETVYATTLITVTSCGSEVTNCPAHSTVVMTTSVPITSEAASSPAQATSVEASSAPASSAPASSTEASSAAVTTPAPETSEASATSPAAATTVETSTAASASSSGCAANLNGNYQYPHLIVPISSSSPNTAEGTSYNGTVTSTVSSIFNFDIPQSYSGQTCSLVFLFPEQSQLETSSYTFSGSGAIDFSMLSGTASESTTYSNAPSIETDYGVTTVQPGNSYTISTFSCPAGETVSYELKTSDSTSLTYFQDYNPSPIGLYIVEC